MTCIYGSRAQANCSLYTPLCALALLAALFSPVVGVPPVAGGAGYARAWDSQARHDVLSAAWRSPPQHSFTFEYWAALGDAHPPYLTLFSYGVLDGSTEPPLHDPQAFALPHNHGLQAILKNGQVARTTTELDFHEELFFSGWQHYAIAFRSSNDTPASESNSSNPGTISFYVNGNLRDTAQEPPGFKLHAPRNGVLLIGQYQGVPGGMLDPATSFDGMVDELRVWSHARSQEEIAGSMSLRLPAGTPGLVAAWDFDSNNRLLDNGSPSTSCEWNIPDVVVEPDVSGQGPDLLLGALPHFASGTVEYSGTNSLTTAATFPDLVPSGARMVGGVVVGHALPGQRISLLLRSFDADGDALLTRIDTLPSRGVLHHVVGGLDEDTTGNPSGAAISAEGEVVLGGSADDTAEGVHIWYQAPEGTGSSEEVDEFSYSVSDDGGATFSAPATARIHIIPQPAPPDLLLYCEEDSKIHVAMGGTTKAGRRAVVEVLSLPDGVGTLHEVVDQSDQDPAPGEAISRVPHTVQDRRGYVVFVPFPEKNNVTAQWTFQWRLDKSSTTAVASAAVHVTALNDPPRPLHATVEAVVAPNTSSSSLTLIELDVDATDGSFTEMLLHRVVSPPLLGTLYQVPHGTDGDVGDEVVDSAWDAPVPTFHQYATSIPDYHAATATPSWSSQFTLCGDCCMVQETCTPAMCPSCFEDTAPAGFQITKALGPPDLYPSTSDSPLGWDFSTPNAGIEFGVLEFNRAVYPTEIHVYETNQPGALIAIDGARSWDGADTEWKSLWQGDASPAGNVARVFSPQICQIVEDKVKIVRLVFDTSAVRGWQNIDAVDLVGSLEFPGGRLQSNRVWYRPQAGIHLENGMTDTFEFTASDCLDESPVSGRVSVAVAPPQLDPQGPLPDAELPQDYWFPVPEVELQVEIAGGDETDSTLLNLTSIVDSALTLMGDSLSVDSSWGREDNTTVSVWVLPSPALELASLMEPDGTPYNVLPALVTSTAAAQHMVLMRPYSVAYAGGRLELWVSFGGVVRRVRSTLTPICQAGLAVTQCATSPLDCQEVQGSVYDSANKVCVTSTGNTRVLLGALIGLAVALMLLFVGVAVLLIRHRKLQRIMNAMDAHAETVLDLDSPMFKTVKYLDDIVNASLRSLRGRRAARSLQDQAIELKAMLLSAHNVLVPDVARQLRQNASITFSNDVIQYLQFQSAPSPDQIESSRSRAVERKSQEFHRTSIDGDVALPTDSVVTGDPPSLTTTDLEEFNLQLIGVDPSFDCLTLQQQRPAGGVLVGVSLHLLGPSGWGVLGTLSIDPSPMFEYLWSIEQSYMDNPYHCVAHAANVVNQIGTLLNMSGIASTLKQTEDGCVTLLAVVLSAAVHDAKHPGVTNQYVINMSMVQAKTYHDQSVLENAALLEALQTVDSKHYVLSRMLSSKAHRRKLRSTIIDMVLATDMSKHFEIMTAFQSKIVTAREAKSILPPITTKRPSKRRLSVTNQRSLQVASGFSHAPDTDLSHVPPWDTLKQDQQILVLKMVIKVADLGHCALPPESHLTWVKRLDDEFYRQGDLEKKYRLPVSALCDRNKPGVWDARGQVGFFKVIVEPLYKEWCRVFTTCSPFLEAVEVNLGDWKAEKFPARPTSHGAVTPTSTEAGATPIKAETTER